MANIVHPEGTYKINQVGPSRPWNFNADGKTIEMVGYSVQFEGIADWVDVNVKADADAPKPGEELQGHIEESKFGYKFTKKRGGRGGFGGGRGDYSKGAQWANAYQTAATVLSGYYTASGKKPATITEYLGKLDEIAPAIRASIDAHTNAGEEKKEDLTQAPAAEEANKPVVLEEVSDKQLGNW